MSESLANLQKEGLEKYSTDEVVVGTYLGKTLYRKTITINSGFDSEFDIASNLTNIVKWSGIGYEGQASICLPYLPFTNNISTYYAYVAAGFMTSTKKWQPQIGTTTLSLLTKIEWTFDYVKS